MDNRIKPGIYSVGGFLGLCFLYWEKARTAEDMVQTFLGMPMPVIYLIAAFAASLMIGFGLSSIVVQLWDYWQLQKKIKEAAEIERHTFSPVAIKRAYEEVLRRSSWIDSLADGADKRKMTNQRFLTCIRDGSLRVAGIRPPKIERELINHEDITEIDSYMDYNVLKRFKVVTKDSPEKWDHIVVDYKALKHIFGLYG